MDKKPFKPLNQTLNNRNQSRVLKSKKPNQKSKIKKSPSRQVQLINVQWHASTSKALLKTYELGTQNKLLKGQSVIDLNAFSTDFLSENDQSKDELKLGFLELVNKTKFLNVATKVFETIFEKKFDQLTLDQKKSLVFGDEKQCENTLDKVGYDIFYKLGYFMEEKLQYALAACICNYHNAHMLRYRSKLPIDHAEPIPTIAFNCLPAF